MLDDEEVIRIQQNKLNYQVKLSEKKRMTKQEKKDPFQKKFKVYE